jgi:hypothetical protein
MDMGEIAATAAAQQGVVTLRQLRASGMTARQVTRRVAIGELTRVHRGVLRLAGAPTSYRQDLVAACLAVGGRAAASHRAAAVLHGLLTYRNPTVEITTSRHRSPELQGVVVHRSRDFGPRWTETVDGVASTTVPRTLVDLGAVVSARTLEAAFDRAAGRRLVTYREVRDALVAVARQGRRGVGALRPLLDERLGRELPAGVFSARMASVLRRAGLATAAPEYTVTDEHGGFVAVVDFAFPDQRLAIEADGYEFHSSPRALADRNARDRLLARLDWQVLHFSWNEVEHRPQRVAGEISSQLRARPEFWAR